MGGEQEWIMGAEPGARTVILAVDDNSVNLRLLKSILEPGVHDRDCAERGGGVGFS
jgi:hypothetical protein